jgi:hypothetical protein
MNIQLANVLGDISGKSGQAIIKDMGQHDPQELGVLCDSRVEKSLIGNFGEMHQSARRRAAKAGHARG